MSYYRLVEKDQGYIAFKRSTSIGDELKLSPDQVQELGIHTIVRANGHNIRDIVEQNIPENIPPAPDGKEIAFMDMNKQVGVTDRKIKFYSITIPTKTP